ncbi:hypothetical protein BSKO_08204 [Bryopsis sp. KO-2023]|nr:hypothetical protein BSKO_08204 [Bryopsis sp. KO-2023]
MALYRLGMMVRETGQALERVGCRLQGVDAFKEDLFRHRSIMNLETIKPMLGGGSWVAPNAAVVGNVSIGEKSSVWYGSVVRGDDSPVEIGSNSNVQDGCTVGGIITEYPQRLPTKIGDNVTVGHGATLSGCTVEDECLIGMGSTLMPGSKVEKGSMVAAGAVIPPDAVVGSGELWGGNPAKLLRKLKQPEADFLPVSADKYSELAAKHSTDVTNLVKNVTS